MILYTYLRLIAIAEVCRGLRTVVGSDAMMVGGTALSVDLHQAPVPEY